MRISQWGDSLAIRLPKKLVEDLGIRENDDVEVREVDDRRIAIVTRDGRTALFAVRRAGRRPAPAGRRRKESP